MAKFLFAFTCLALCSLLLCGCTQKVFVVHHPFKPEYPLAQVSKIPKVSYQPPFKEERKLIVIDPGHGGKDDGAELGKKNIKEKNFNLTTAKFLESYLKQLGYETLLTRQKDDFISLDNRANIANSHRPALFVSVHYNSAPSVKADGIEIYYYKSDSDKGRVSASKALAESILECVIEETHAKSRGVKHGNLAVIRKTTMPAVLVEGGFLTNELELAKIKDPAYLKTIAWGIAQGVDAYLRRQGN